MVKNIYLVIFFLFLTNCSTYIVSDDTSNNKIDFVKSLIENKKYSRAIDELNYILFNDPLSEFSALAQFYIAECYFYLNDFNQSIIEYNKYLTRNDTVEELVKKSQYMLCKCYFNISLEYNKDQTDTYIAIEKLQYFIEKTSMNEYSSDLEIMILDLRTKLAKKDFYNAKLYVKIQEIDAALIYFDNIVNEYYDTEFVDDALTNIAIIYSQEDIKKAKDYISKYKNNFLDSANFEETNNLISSLKSGQNKSYYLAYLK